MIQQELGRWPSILKIIQAEWQLLVPSYCRFEQDQALSLQLNICSKRSVHSNRKHSSNFTDRGKALGFGSNPGEVLFSTAQQPVNFQQAQKRIQNQPIAKFRQSNTEISECTEKATQIKPNSPWHRSPLGKQLAIIGSHSPLHLGKYSSGSDRCSWIPAQPFQHPSLTREQKCRKWFTPKKPHTLVLFRNGTGVPK